MIGNKPPLIEFQIIVTGNVQGVFFRAKTKDHADHLGLKGYVRNLSDGSVEICVMGEKIDALLDALNKEPLPIQIDQMKISKRPLKKTYDQFTIRNTA